MVVGKVLKFCNEPNPICARPGATTQVKQARQKTNPKTFEVDMNVVREKCVGWHEARISHVTT